MNILSLYHLLQIEQASDEQEPARPLIPDLVINMEAAEVFASTFAVNFDHDCEHSAAGTACDEQHACNTGTAQNYLTKFKTWIAPHVSCKLQEGPRLPCKICRFMELRDHANPYLPQSWKMHHYRYLERPCPLTPYLSHF
jgi:hypothetical protein